MATNLTVEEREKFLNENRDKLASMLKRDYPREDVEEFVQRAVLASQYRQFPTEAAFMSYLKDKATFIAIDSLNDRIYRRNTLKGLPKHKPTPDPMRHIDWRIDLERAITKATHDNRLRSALWHHIYEGYTQEEVAEMAGTVQQRINEALIQVRRIMRRGGYRDGVTSSS